MKRHQTHIFATRADLEPNLRLIESQMRLKYVALHQYTTGSDGKPFIVPHKSPEFEEFESLLEIPTLGTNQTGDHVTGQDYLIGNADAEVRVESVIQRKGGIHYFVNGFVNPPLISFSPGGRYQDSFLICGHIGTVAEHPESIALYKAFTKTLTRGFKKIGNYKVGPDAQRLMKEGIRMITMGVDSPPEYDLRFQ